MPMRAIDRPALCAQLLFLSAGADAFCVPPLSHRSVRGLATERQALVMNAGGGSPIPELAALYEAAQGLTYAGWEQDVKREESLWVEGWTTAASIKLRVVQMRRRQRLHDSRKLTDEEAEESARAYDEAQVVLQTVHDRHPAEPHDQNA